MDKFTETVDLFLVERFNVLEEDNTIETKSSIIQKLKNELTEENLAQYGEQLDQASKLYETLDNVISELDEQFVNFINTELTQD